MTGNLLVRLAPIVLRVAKVIVVIAPHVLAAYQYRKEQKFFPNRKKPNESQLPL